MTEPDLGHQGIVFELYRSGELVFGEFSLEPGPDGNLRCWFGPGLSADEIAGTKEAFALLERDHKDECIARLRTIYDRVEEKWVAADHSMLDSSHFERQFDQ